MYKEFALVYDKLMNDFNYEEWFFYIEEIFKKENIKPESILEMACGTGNLSEYLARANYNLTCFDISSDMLSMADSKLSQYKNVNIYKQNMVDFSFNKKYDSVISICDSINYLLEDEEILKTFKNVFDHLEEGGVFIFDINSFYKLSEIIGNNIFIEDRDDLLYTWENFYDEESKVVEFYLNFFVEKENGLYERFTEEHYERAYKVEEIIGFLKSVGFKKVDFYKAFSFDGIEEETERINFVARK